MVQDKSDHRMDTPHSGTVMGEQSQSRIKKFHIFDNEIVSIKNGYKLLKFKVQTKNKFLNELAVTVSKIHFDNPSGVVSLFIQNNFHSYAVKNSFDFTIYDEYYSMGAISPGKLNQYVACGDSDKLIAKNFPEYFHSDPTCYCLNISRIDFLEVIGLSQESLLMLECYRLQPPTEFDVDFLTPPVC